MSPLALSAAWLVTAVLLTGCQKPSESRPRERGLENALPSGVSAPNAKASAAKAPATLPPARAAPERSTSAPSARPRRRYRVAAFGDSITDERSGGGGYLRQLRRACPESQFDNFGRGGDMTNQIRRRFEVVLPSLQAKYDTLLVYGGVNDLYSNLTAGRTNDRIEADLSAVYAAARDKGLFVVAVTVSPWGGFKRHFTADRGRNTRLLNAWILGARTTGLVDLAVDSYPLLSCGNPDEMCRDYQGPGQDGLHPGPRGHELLGQALQEQAFEDCL
jgi:lysophospholipase L1-like esterase